MRVTTKGQVTIPLAIREKLGIVPSAEVDFVEENGPGLLGEKGGAGDSKTHFFQTSWCGHGKHDHR